MSRPSTIALPFLVVLLALSTDLSAQSGAGKAPAKMPLVKLGTVAPNGSSFHKILIDMGSKWAATPSGVQLRIYPGGIAGGEADMVMKMKIGQIDAALMTANGLADIDPAVQSLQAVPMLFRSLDEVAYVTQKMRPKLDQRLREKGFVVLFWTDAGWVHFFSKSPVQRPADLKKTKLFTWSGDTKTFDLYKSAGFAPVALETNDILPMLRTGMISSVPLPPSVALATQTFTAANNMLDLDWAPLVGALVITERSWNKLTPQTQAALAKAAAEAGVAMRKENRAASEAAVEAMKKRGLKSYRPDGTIEAEWRGVAEASYPRIRGNIVPADYFDEVRRLLNEYRMQQATAR
jgi:TRAP-type C4-dicarboxylate transport system substrate-binding protein